jgi:hypothetical protein
MRRTKTRVGCSSAVAASSSSSEDDISLGASPSQEEAPTPPAPSTDAASSSGTSQRRGGMPRSEINLPASTRHSGRTIFQCKFVKVLVFFLKKLQHNL